MQTNVHMATISYGDMLVIINDGVSKGQKFALSVVALVSSVASVTSVELRALCLMETLLNTFSVSQW